MHIMPATTTQHKAYHLTFALALNIEQDSRALLDRWNSVPGAAFNFILKCSNKISRVEG